MAADPEKILAAVLRNPRAAAQALAKHRAEASLIDFNRLMWKVLEPGNPMRVNWVMEAVCTHLEAVSKGQIRNLLINLPPGMSKSLCTGVFWPAWEWGPCNRADLRIISWSYAEHLTKRDNDRTRTLLYHPLYQALWGDRVRLKKDQNEKKYFKTDREGWKMASTVGGVGTGERGDRLILDDPHSVDGADSDADRNATVSWFGGTMTTRTRNANAYPELVDGLMTEPSKMVVIMQRVHRKDVSGVLLDLMAQGYECEHLLIEQEWEGADHPARRTSGWRPSSIGWVDPRGAWTSAIDAELARMRAARAEAAANDEAPSSTFRQTTDQLDALGQAHDDAMARWDDLVDVWGRIVRDQALLADPARFSRQAVEENKLRMRRKLGSNAVASQFQQWPYEGSGLLFKREKFNTIHPRDVPQAGRSDARGWDLAASDASTADRTALVRLRMDDAGRIYVMHAHAVRLTPGGVEKTIRDTLKADGTDVIQSFPQDPGSAGKHMVHFIARTLAQGYRFRSSPEMKKKSVRAEPFAAQVEHGNVFLVEAPWNEEYITEFVEFDQGDHDDFIDATVRAYDALLQLGEPAEPVGPKLFKLKP